MGTEKYTAEVAVTTEHRIRQLYYDLTCHMYHPQPATERNRQMETGHLWQYDENVARVVSATSSLTRAVNIRRKSWQIYSYLGRNDLLGWASVNRHRFKVCWQNIIHYACSLHQDTNRPQVVFFVFFSGKKPFLFPPLQMTRDHCERWRCAGYLNTLFTVKVAQKGGCLMDAPETREPPLR